jgi:hypothetical protein
MEKLCSRALSGYWCYNQACCNWRFVHLKVQKDCQLVQRSFFCRTKLNFKNKTFLISNSFNQHRLNLTSMDISKKVNLESIEKLVSEVGNQTLPTDLIINADVDKDLGFTSDHLILSVHPQASFSLKLFNNVADEDHFFPALDQNNSIKDESIRNWDPDFFTNKALLKYSFIGQLKLGGALSVKNLNLGLDINEHLLFETYLVHNHNEKLGEAVLNDLKSLKILIHPLQIRSLAQNEAISFQRLGKLEFEASLKLSDVISGALDGLTSLVNNSKLVKVKLQTGFEIKFKIELDGDFKLFVTKENDSYNVKIYRLTRKLSSFQIGAGIELEIENKDSLLKIVEDLIGQGEEEVIKKANQLLNKASKALSDDETNIIKEAAKVLNIFLETEDIIEEYKDEYNKIKNDFLDKLKNGIQNKLKGGLEYEYSKIQSSEALFEAILTEEAIDKHFNNLIAFKLKDLANPNMKGIIVKSYFKVDKESISKSFGIGLSFGNWKLLSGVKKQVHFSEIEKYDITAKKFVFSLSNYTAVVIRNVHHGKFHDSYHLALNANLNTFEDDPKFISCDKLDYSFDIIWRTEENRINKNELIEILDLAVCWDIIDENNITSYQDELFSIISNVRNIEVSGYLKIPEGQFDHMISLIASASNPEIAFSLAACVPYHDINGRRTIQERINNYIGWWNLYLSREVAMTKINSLITNHFFGLNKEELARFESHTNNPKSITSLVTHELKPDIVKFQANFKTIHDGIDKRRHYKDVLAKGYKKIDELNIKNQFVLRFLGRFLLDMAKKSGIENQIEKTIKIEFAEQNKQNIFILK